MKLNLMLDGADPRSGYRNVDPYARPGDGKVPCGVTCLDPVACPAQARELVALDVIDFVQPDEVDRTIEHWVSRLRRGGSIAIGGVELPEVCRRVAAGDLGVDAANMILYGRQRAPWQYRKSASSLPLVAAKLRSLGLEVTSSAYNDPMYLVTARRP